MGLQAIKSIHYEEKPIEYKVLPTQVYQSFPDYLTNTFQLQLRTFLFQSMFVVDIKFNLNLFLKKMNFNANTNQMRIKEMDGRIQMNQLFSFLENLMKKLTYR